MRCCMALLVRLLFLAGRFEGVRGYWRERLSRQGSQKLHYRGLNRFHPDLVPL